MQKAIKLLRDKAPTLDHDGRRQAFRAADLLEKLAGPDEPEKPRILVAVVDEQTGDVEGTDLLEVGYVVLTAPEFESLHEQRFSNGTVQLTIKRKR